MASLHHRLSIAQSHVSRNVESCHISCVRVSSSWRPEVIGLPAPPDRPGLCSKSPAISRTFCIPRVRRRTERRCRGTGASDISICDAYAILAEAVRACSIRTGCGMLPELALSTTIASIRTLQHCSVKPSANALPAINRRSAALERVGVFPLPTDGQQILHVDAGAVDDMRADGSADAPFATLHAAVAAVRASRAYASGRSPVAPVTIALRAGTHFLRTPLDLNAGDSHITFQAHPDNEDLAWISGGVPIVNADGSPVSWTPATPPARSAYEWRAGSLSDGFDVAPAGSYTVAAAQALCTSLPLCSGFTYSNASPNPSGPVMVSFKYALFFSRGTTASTWVKNKGYLPGGGSLLVADVSSVPLTARVDSLRVNGTRAIRARYPNVDTVELMGAMQLIANSWTAQSARPVADYTFNPATPLRNETTQDGRNGAWFSTFRIGVGGPCASRFVPAASYWCSNNSEGGGPGPYEAPVGMVVSNATDRLPHTPYTHGAVGAAVHSWRAGRWFSWVFGKQVPGQQSPDCLRVIILGARHTIAYFCAGQFVVACTFNLISPPAAFHASAEVNASEWSPATQSTTFHFGAGGNQGSRGGNAGQEFFIEVRRAHCLHRPSRS